MWKSSIYMHIYIFTIYVNIHTDIQTYRHTDIYTYIHTYIYFMVITATGLEPPSLTAIYLVQSIYIYICTHMYVCLTLTSSLAWPIFYHSPWKGMNLR